MAERWLPTSKPMQDAVLKTADDQNWFVRRQLAATLGELPPGQRLQPLLAVLGRYGDDPITVDAAVSSLSGQEAEALAVLLKQPQPAADPVMALAGAASKRRDPATIQTLLAVAGDTRQAMPLRTAVLTGVRLGLQGGRPSQDQVVVGGRAGAAVPGVARRGAAVELLPLTAPPQTLTTAAAGQGDLAAVARQVVALVTWPGKPAPPAVAPRTPAEEKMFAAGKTIYAEQCSGCHQAEGQGAEHVGAKLAGSPFVNASPDVLVRILTNGKEGAVGLMPPLGQAMSDDDVASVLTFIRGSWGNTSAPVVPAAVKETRQAYAHRETPWTDAELTTRRR
jgi:mono/diheme cytochrome c family protein